MMVFIGLFVAVITVCIASVSTQDRAIFPELILTSNVVRQDSASRQSCPIQVQQSTRNENEMSSCVCTYLQSLTNPDATEGSAAESCQQIAQLCPNTTSDYYWIRTANGLTTRFYCDMLNRCGQPDWTWVAFANMNDSSQSCPNGLAEVTHNGLGYASKWQTFLATLQTLVCHFPTTTFAGVLLATRWAPPMPFVPSKTVAIVLIFPLVPKLIPYWWCLCWWSEFNTRSPKRAPLDIWSCN